MENQEYADSLPEGYKLHWYEITGVIGRGGFGITYLARDLNLDMLVAVKEFLPQDFASRKNDSTVHPRTEQQSDLYNWGLERFVAEARILAKFTHPNIVRVLSVFEQNNTAYMVMEYARGQHLANIYGKQANFTEKDYLDIFIPICDGLALVHGEGFIHRDIKPENIYLSNDNIPLLLDFGSARQSIGTKTKALTSLVTYGYAPFEQYNEGTDKQGPWTDIYSLGASIYRGITGDKPEDALSRGSHLLEDGKDPYQPVSISAAGRFSEHFLLAVDNALTFKANRRPQHIMRWADMLLGKIESPALPADLFEKNGPEQTEKTRVRTPSYRNRTDSDTVESTSGRRRKLISARGQRSSEPTATEKHAIKPSRMHALGKAIAELGERWHAADAGTRYAIAFLGAATLSLVTVLGFIDGGQKETTRHDNRELSRQIANEEINKLLALAEDAKQQGKLIEPAKTNAYDYFKQILSRFPGNKQALDGITDIEKQLLSLANKEFESGRFTSAKYHLDRLLWKMPDSTQAKDLLQTILSREKSLGEIDLLLKRAQTSLDMSRFTEPTGDNAWFYFTEIIAVDPDNRDAKNGLENLERRLLALAEDSYRLGDLEGAQAYLDQAKRINPASDALSRLQQKIAGDETRKDSISKLLATADKYMDEQHYSTPTNANAYDSYRQVLKLDASNKTAQEGITRIRNYYQREFDKRLNHRHFQKAEYFLQRLRHVGVASAQIKKLENSLASEKNSQQPEIQRVSNVIARFKEALELKDPGKIDALSQYRKGRKTFVRNLFRQYKSYQVAISGFKYISREHKAYAQVELSKLIDISNSPVISGNWNRFEIVSKQNANGKFVILW